MAKTKTDKIDSKYNLKVYLNQLSRYKMLFVGAAIMAFLAQAISLGNNFLFKSSEL